VGIVGDVALVVGVFVVTVVVVVRLGGEGHCEKIIHELSGKTRICA
jgi:hypothetical protein